MSDAQRDGASPVDGDDLARRLASLSPARRAYLERLVAAGAPALVPRPRQGQLPLSYGQERLWFLHQLEPESTAYTIFSASSITDLDVPAMRAAVADVVARHEVLRTRYVAGGDGPRGEVETTLQVVPEIVDLRAESDPQAAVRRLAGDVARSRFDLTRPPLVRVVCARVTDSESALLLAFHHIVIDHWSMRVLYSDLGAAYRSRAAGVPPVLPPLALQFGDYAVWQREAVGGARLAALLGWWRERLHDAPPVVLPSDRPRPPAPSHSGARHRLEVPAPVAAGLAALAQAERATPFMALFAAWSILLARWSGQDDVQVGVPVAGRGRAELEPLVGFFVNTLVLRVQVDHAASFRDLLHQVRDLALEAYAHEDVPFELLVRELAPRRDPSENPLFQTTFQLVERGDREVAGLPFLEQRHPAVAFDLQVEVRRSDAGLSVRLDYATDLFDAATIGRLGGHYQTLLAAIAAGPDAPIRSLELLTDEERETQRRWNATAAPIAETSVDALVEAQARSTPDEPAIVERGRVVRYGELVRRAEAVAGRLVALGAARDRPVALLLPRGADQVTAALAAMRSGAAYLPLDPATPHLRLASVLEQADPAALITSRALAGNLPAGLPPLLLIEGDAADAPPPPTRAVPSDLAYIIPTSGSTGVPKLVSVEHASVVNLVEWHTETYGLGPGDRVALTAAVSFDASVWEMWPALACGATLVVPDDTTRRSVPELAAWLAGERITVAFLPPALAEPLLTGEPLAGLRLRVLLTGGDVLHAPPPGERSFPLVNHYGPTESTVVSTAATVPSDAPAGSRPSIGAPIRNVEAYVLDPHGRQQPIGVPGELYLGGAGLARGYQNDAAATAAAFVRSPLTPGGRLYRTGDRVAWRADGTLRFLGRADEQLELRGMRVEPGDIVAQLRSHPGVSEATVTLHDGGLAAFVVPADATPLDPAALRAYLAGRLPVALLPASYTMLDALPVTPHGKLDRAALPVPSAPSGGGGETETATEASVAAIFAELLDATAIGPDDDFFELGGHSLLATRLAARIHAELGTEVPVRLVFEAASVRRLAAAIDHSRAAGSAAAPTELRPAPRRRHRARLDEDGRPILSDALRTAVFGLAGTPPGDDEAPSSQRSSS